MEGNKQKRQKFSLTLIIVLNWCKNTPNGGYYYENNDYMGFYGLVDGPCGNRDIYFTCHLLFLVEG